MVEILGTTHRTPDKLGVPETDSFKFQYNLFFYQRCELTSTITFIEKLDFALGTTFMRNIYKMESVYLSFFFFFFYLLQGDSTERNR